MRLMDWVRSSRKKSRIRRKRVNTPLWLERLETRTLPAPLVSAIDRSVPSAAETDATSVTYAVKFGGPHVRIVDFATQQQLDEFFAYDLTFTGGLYVAGNGT